MTATRKFFSKVRLDGLPLATLGREEALIRDRALLKDFLEYVHVKKGLLEAYYPAYPLVELRELLPSFEKNFAEYKHLPCFSLVVLNRPLSYQQEIFQFDLLHSAGESGRRGLKDNLDKISPHLDRHLRGLLRTTFSGRDLTDLSCYKELLPFLFHMDRAQVIARDAKGVFRLEGVYASFPSDLDTELKAFGKKLGKFKKLDDAAYEKERYFVYQFLMELYGFPIAAERRTSAALFARKLSRLKEQYLIKVLGASDRTITCLSGFDQKRYPLVEKIALIALPPGLAEAHPHLKDQGFYLDPERRVVIFKVTYLQHQYHHLNVLEDRALSVLRQELIHPVTGEREAGLNLLKDTKRIFKDLTDILRGEHLGSITYKRTDFLTSTKTHEDRLKFLSAWLTKNQRRLASYGPDSFEAALKMLNGYLLRKGLHAAFVKQAELHREVLQKVVYLTQAHRLQELEKLSQTGVSGGLGPSRRLAHAVAFLEEHREALPYFYEDLFKKCLNIWARILSNPYFKRLEALPAPPEAAYRRRVWHTLNKGKRLIALLDDQHRQIMTAAARGVPLPLLPPESAAASES
jgi:hypothetical protein